MLKIIVDSTTDLTDDFIKENNIDLISLQVIIDNVSFRDRKEIDVTELFTAIPENKNVKTSLPNLSDMYDTFKEYAKENKDFVFFTFSKKMSGTYNAATIIINELKEKYNSNMAVIDTKNGGMASALIVKRFMNEINDKMTFDEKVEHAINLTNKMRQVFLVNDLSQLKRGGRISSLQSLIGSLIHIKPILYINDGEIKIHKNTIGTKRALKELINYTEKHVSDKNKTIGMSYVMNLKILEDTKKALNDAGYNNIITERLASVMAAHIGLDAVSINFFID